MRRVLSISGGGMRGVIPARMLIELERMAGRPLCQVFDMVCGTSTGGILACLIAAGVPALDAIRFYYEAGPRIFKQGLLSWAKQGISTKYGNETLKAELKNAIGEYRLSEAKTRTMVTTLTEIARAEMVKSWDPEWSDLKLWEAALMTSAAQTYLPQAHVARRQPGYLDGGNVRNAPMVCARDEAFRLWWGEEILLVHLGTGQERIPEKLPNAGVLSWMPKLFNTTTKGDDSFDRYGCELFHKLPIPFEFQSFDVLLDRFPAMDDARKTTLDGLVSVTESAISAARSDWNDLGALLKAA